MDYLLVDSLINNIVSLVDKSPLKDIYLNAPVLLSENLAN